MSENYYDIPCSYCLQINIIEKGRKFFNCKNCGTTVTCNKNTTHRRN